VTKVEILYQGFKQKTLPNINWHMTGDMSSRMDFIQLMFKGVKTITELGTFQGCSTSAWLKLEPKKLLTVDINRYLDEEIFKQAAKEINVDFKYIIQDDLTINLDPCELLFIDTSHVEEHTYLELQRHSDKATQYIVFHDIVEPRFGTMPGIRRWWKNNPQWIEKYKDLNECGFLVLQKN
jgi:predicted O-methyltransferase YrrM